MEQGTNTNMMIIIGAETALVYGILFCLLLWWLIFRIVRVFIKHKDAFGHTVTLRLVALGFTVWLEPRALTAPIEAVRAFVEPFLKTVPPLITSFAIYGRSGEISSLANFMPKLTGMFVAALTEFLSKLQLPVLVFALVLWAALGSLLSVLLQNQTKTVVSELFSRLASISLATRVYCALFAILVVSCFLSISTIIVIPYLRQLATEPTEPEVAQLATRLDESGIPAEVYKNRYPPDFPAPVAVSKLRDTVKGLIGSSTSTQPVASPGGSHTELAVFNSVLDTVFDERDKLVTEYRDLREQESRQQISLRNAATRIFAVTRGRGKEEREFYSTELDNWYRVQVSIIENDLSNCVQNIRVVDGGLNQFSGIVEPLLSSTGGLPGMTQIVEPLKESLTKLGGKTCRRSVIESNPPELNPARNWGLSGWLLTNKSLDVALITGMLGFGLFGAAISTVVRRGRLLEFQSQALIADLVGVIFRGLSAAIVVFLATLGGLAIFSTSGTGQATEPNPYALFLACLAAAVFSEDVWLRVRRRLREQADSTEVAESVPKTPEGSQHTPQTSKSKGEETHGT